MNITIPGRGRAAALSLAFVAAALCANPLRAQAAARDTLRAASDSVSRSAVPRDSLRARRRRFYRRFATGFATSILLHESAHIGASYAMGFHPHLGFDKGRPTVFSGINEFVNRRQQFIFSAAGLTAQNLLDEIVLDVPHRRGGAFERGILAGGLGTTLFYATIGRNARVSDITVMSRTSHLSRSQLSLIFGSASALHAFRMSRDRAYSRFFVAPASGGAGLSAGLALKVR